MTPSWRLKLFRAEEHFSHLKDLIGVPLGRRVYPVTETLKPDGEYHYTLDLPGSVDEMVPIIAGDLLFNIRSGLDHLLCALIPDDDKGRAQFPIFTRDPLATDPMTGSFADPNARNNWRRHTRGVPDAPLAVLTQLQPFNQAKGTGKSADHHTLAVLTNLQNADKHRQLTFLGPVLKQTLVSLEGQQMGVVPGYHNGAEVHYSPYPVDVEVEGVVAIPFGLTRQEGYEYPLMFDLILDFVANEVLPALEPLVP